jgi:predicted phage-related endonuclease
MWRSRAHPLAFANPDGLTTDGGGLECKSHSWRMADEWDEDQVSDGAELQSQWYMGVTGIKHWWVIAQLGDDEPVIRRLEFDAELFASLLTTAKSFWHDYVLTDREPPVGSVDLDAVKDRYRVVEVESVPMAPDDVEPLIGEWESAKAAVKAAEQRAAVALATLRNVVGAAEQVTVAGHPRLTCKANGTFAAARFAADHPDVAASLSTKPALDLERVKSEHPDLYQAYRARVLRAVTPK